MGTQVTPPQILKYSNMTRQITPSKFINRPESNRKIHHGPDRQVCPHQGPHSFSALVLLLGPSLPMTDETLVPARSVKVEDENQNTKSDHNPAVLELQ